MSVIAAVISAVGGLVTAIGGLWIAWVKLRSDVQAAKGSRMDKLEERLDLLQERYDAERSKRITAENTTHRLKLALVTLIDHVEAMHEWVMGGATPPPPTTPDLTEAKALVVR
ncbi:hypothetical protein ACQZES_05610 [Corynebacterium diphtheriae]